MSTHIGRIEVPAIVASGAFPLRTDYPHGMTLGRTVVTHTFANGVEQRFYMGNPATRYTFTRHTLTGAQRAALASFWQTAQGCVGAFSYDVPQEDGTFVSKTVRFEDAPLRLEDVADAICSVGLTLVEIPDPATAPVYTVGATVTRFPDETLSEALLNEVQEIIPLVRIRVVEAAVPDILLSDRLVTLTYPAITDMSLPAGATCPNEHLVETLPYSYQDWLNPANADTQMQGGATHDHTVYNGNYLSGPCEQFRISLAPGRTYRFNLELVAFWDRIYAAALAGANGDPGFPNNVNTHQWNYWAAQIIGSAVPVNDQNQYWNWNDVIAWDLYKTRMTDTGSIVSTDRTPILGLWKHGSTDVEIASGTGEWTWAVPQDIDSSTRLFVYYGGAPVPADIHFNLTVDQVVAPDQTYLPRLLQVGEQGSDVLIEQSIDGSSDDVQFAFGNADRVMIKLANDTELIGARIELSLYHVGSQRKLDLWAGLITVWSSDAGTEFKVGASDQLSALTLSSPVGTCCRSCWRRYGQDGCPATIGTQEIDTAHYRNADASTCDLGYETENGCLAHSGGANPTKRYFGGIWAKPQQVRILNNSTGTWGFGRDVITPTSQISDSLWGQSLPEIWHNDDDISQQALPVTCRIAAGREESDFYIALGVVGRGPLGALATAQMVDTDSDGKKETFVGSTLDGQPHHGWKTDDNGNPTGNDYGLRKVLGTDPAGTNDFFSLGRVGTSPSNWREIVGGASVYEDTYAAGVAFLEIRRVDEKGVQLSALSSHAMTAMISKGLTGKTWTEPGARVDIPGCTNVFWVAINTFLRAIGKASEAASTQEQYFDAAAAINSAAAADLVVPPIVGTGNETQFRFKGTIDASKPTRDWLRDILNNGLGYFTWSFGKLKVGCRNTATPITTFQPGNMLLGSLQMEPLRPGFEKLTVEFGDEEYLFAHNTVSYTDQDYAARNGRVANPRESQFGLAGTATKSQALRIAVCRTREELGGVGETEQKSARNASWKSTIMALDVEAGTVVSVLDDELAGGGGTFRVQSWRLNRDWSVDVRGKTVRPSMYDLTAGAVPSATTEAVQPIAGARDNGAPPTPSFQVRISTVDPSAIEIYNLAFAQTTNTRTINSATFTILTSDAVSRVVTVNFPLDFFSTAGAASWTYKVSLPGKRVIAVAGLVTNAYGSSASYATGAISLDLAAAALQSGEGETSHAVVFNEAGKIVDAGYPLMLPMGFYIGWGGDVAVGDDIAKHRYIDVDCVPIRMMVSANTAPTGADQLISVYLHRAAGGADVLITTAAAPLLDGHHTAFTTSFAANMAFASGDYLYISSTCADTPGADLLVEILCGVTTP